MMQYANVVDFKSEEDERALYIELVNCLSVRSLRTVPLYVWRDEVLFYAETCIDLDQDIAHEISGCHTKSGNPHTISREMSDFEIEWEEIDE